jgi:hypothetical protein
MCRINGPQTFCCCSETAKFYSYTSIHRTPSVQPFYECYPYRTSTEYPWWHLLIVLNLLFETFRRFFYVDDILHEAVFIRLPLLRSLELADERPVVTRAHHLLGVVPLHMLDHRLVHPPQQVPLVEHVAPRGGGGDDAGGLLGFARQHRVPEVIVPLSGAHLEVGLSLPARVSDWLHGPYVLVSSIGAFDHTSY